MTLSGLAISPGFGDTPLACLDFVSIGRTLQHIRGLSYLFSGAIVLRLLGHDLRLLLHRGRDLTYKLCTYPFQVGLLWTLHLGFAFLLLYGPKENLLSDCSWLLRQFNVEVPGLVGGEELVPYVTLEPERNTAISKFQEDGLEVPVCQVQQSLSSM